MLQFIVECRAHFTLEMVVFLERLTNNLHHMYLLIFDQCGFLSFLILGIFKCLFFRDILRPLPLHLSLQVNLINRHIFQFIILLTALVIRYYTVPQLPLLSFTALAKSPQRLFVSH